MRQCKLTLAILLFFSAGPTFAKPPLPPGKPAGVRAAQTATGIAIFVSAAVLIAVAGFAISNHPYVIPGQASTTSTGR